MSRYDHVLDFWIKFGGHVMLFGLTIVLVVKILTSNPSPD